MDLTELLTPSLPVGELISRGSITFLLLYLLIRIVGRRESGAVGMTDVLVIVLVADAASTGMTGDSDTLGDGFILVIVVLFWSIVVDALGYVFPGLSRFIKSGPKPLIKDGQLVRSTMRREFMTYEELLSQLRLHGVQDPAEVDRAYIESNGSVSVVLKEKKSEPGAN